MSLKQALSDCLIDFDRRVLVTDLLEEYKMSYKEVSETLEEFMEKQSSSATTYHKRYLVHGQRKEAPQDELYTIVQESQLKDWLQKLQNAESQLYSVEVAGGSKVPAAIFKPMQHFEVKLDKLEKRAASAPASSVSNFVNGASKPAVPTSNGVSKSDKEEHEKASGSKPKVETVEPAKTSPKEPSAKTPKATAASSKKGTLNSFLTAAPAAKSKEAKATAKPPVATMNNFFKKQPASAVAKTSPPVKKEPSPKKDSPANTSVQLFAEASSESSDEEEKLDKLRRNVLNSDDEDAANKSSSNTKRRRILDSDDEEQPPKKSNEVEEVMIIEDVEEPVAANETFLDDDGFVITQRKPNKSQVGKKKASPPTKRKASPIKKKSPPSTTKAKGSDATKTKQGNIMSFFQKK